MRKVKLFRKSVALVMCMLVTLVNIPVEEVKAAEIIKTNPLIDIIVNPCSDYSMTYEEFSQDLADAISEKLEDKRTAYQNDGDDTTDPSSVASIDDVRISQAGIQLNTLDLSDWYIYDHYNNTSTNNTNSANTSVPSSWNSYNGKKPYFGYCNVLGITTNTTIEEYTQGTTMQQASSNVQTIDRHILSSVDEFGKASMTFCGYGDRPYNDFLFYPASTRYKKHITFDFDATKVRIHSMSGSGFLINAGVDTNGKLQGYLLYISYGSAVASSTMYIYRLDGNQTPEFIHQNMNSEGTGYSSSTGIGCINKEEVAHANLNLNTTTLKGKLIIDISTDYLTVQHQPYTNTDGTQGSIETIFNNVGINTAAFPYTNYNGFGPFVSYSSHSCSTTSFFVYSDLSMSYQTDSFEAVRNSQFATDRADGTVVGRYFINLAEQNPEIPEVASEYKEGLRRLTDDKIKYISNVVDATDVTGTVTCVSTTLGYSNTCYVNGKTYDEYVDSIAEYIVGDSGWDSEVVTTESLVAPAAKFTVVGKEEGEADTAYAQTLSIHLKHLQDSNKNVVVSFADASYPVDSSRPIVKWEYTIRDSNGVIQSSKIVTSDSVDKTPPTYKVTPSSAEGTYTMSLIVTDSQGVVSTSSTLPFTIINDEIAPTIAITSSETELNTAVVTFSDSGSGVEKYRIGTGSVVKLATVRSSATCTIAVPQDGTEVSITVWDECGNSDTRSFNTCKVTYYKGLDDNTTAYGDPQYVFYGCKVGVYPAAPTDTEDNGFAGWFTTTAKTTPFDTSNKITSNTSVYGKWSSTKVNVTFDPNGGTIDGVSGNKNVNVVAGTLYKNIAISIPVKEGYEFAGWLKNGSSVENSQATEEATLTASWRYGKVLLTLDPNGGVSGTVSSIMATNRTGIKNIIDSYGTASTNPTKRGYTFLKWAIKKTVDGVDTYVDITASNLLGDNGAIVYAMWQRDYMAFSGKTMVEGTYGRIYQDMIQATNGTGKFKYTVTGNDTSDAWDQLPAGLTLDENTGAVTGNISGTPGTYRFNITASEQPNAYIEETEDTITKEFVIVVSVGTRPTLSDETIEVKFDATDINTVISELYNGTVGVDSAAVGTPTEIEGNLKYPVVITYNTGCGGGTATYYVTATSVYPVLEPVISDIPSISAIQSENSDESHLLAYLNGEIYRELKLADGENEAYNAAKGTAPASWELPEYEFDDEASDPVKSYNQNGDTYTFTQQLEGGAITRTLTVNPISIVVNTSTIRKFADESDFTPGFTAGVTNGIDFTPLDGATLEYSIPAENEGDGVVAIDGNTISLVNTGTTSVLATGSKEYYTTGSSVFTLVVNTRPVVTTGSAIINIEATTSTMKGKVILGTENDLSNGFIDAGFKYRRSGATEYIRVPADIGTDGIISAELTGLQPDIEYEYYAYCETQTGMIEGSGNIFVIQDDVSIETDATYNITSDSATIAGSINSGVLIGKGFEYRVKGDATFVKVPLTLSDSTIADITGLLPSTEYQYRVYAGLEGRTVYGDIAEFTTAAYVPIPTIGVQIIGEEDVYGPRTSNASEYDIISAANAIGIKILASDGVTAVSNINVENLVKIDEGNVDLADPVNIISYDGNTGEINIGSNIKKADLMIELTDTQIITVHYQRGALEVGTVNESVNVVSNVDEDYLKTSVDISALSGLIETGSSVDIKLVVSDMEESEGQATGFVEYADENINSEAHLLYINIKVKQVVNGDEQNAIYISQLTKPIFIELDINPEVIAHAKDLRVLHKRQDGKIEMINVVRNGCKIGFYVQNFSPYALVYVNNYSVSYSFTGLGNVTPSRQDATLLEGEDITYQIIAATNYHIDSITDNGIAVNASDLYAINNINANHNIVVNFKKDQYKVTATKNGDNGVISPVGEQQIDVGGNLTYNFAAKEGYFIKDVIIDGVSIGGNISTYTFTNITGAHSIEVVFEKKQEPTIEESTSEETTSEEPTTDTKVEKSTVEVEKKEVVVLDAAPGTGDKGFALPAIVLIISALGVLVIEHYTKNKK